MGPLVREEAQVAAEQRPGTVPLLLLNTLPGNGFIGNQLYQFALSPEDEARQIARQIAGSGKRNVAVLAPSGDWGTRVAGAFTEELTRDGGGVVAQGSYDLAKNDLTTSLTAALGINEARARQQRVQQAINARSNSMPIHDLTSTRSSSRAINRSPCVRSIRSSSSTMQATCRSTSRRTG